MLCSLLRVFFNIFNSSDVSDYVRDWFKKFFIQQGKYLFYCEFVDNKVSVDIYVKYCWYWIGIYLDVGMYECKVEGEWVD